MVLKGRRSLLYGGAVLLFLALMAVAVLSDLAWLFVLLLALLEVIGWAWTWVESKRLP